MKKKYEVWRRLRYKSGWGWDELRQLVVGPHEEAWVAEIKRDKLAKDFRTQPLLYRAQLEQLYDGITADGEFAIYSQQSGVQKDRSMPSDLTDNASITVNPGDKKFVSSPTLPERTPVASGRVSAVGVNFRQRTKPDLTGNLRLSMAVESLADAELVTKLAVRKFNEEYTLASGVWSKRQIIKCYCLLQDRSKAEVFLALPAGELRDGWLEEELNELL